MKVILPLFIAFISGVSAKDVRGMRRVVEKEDDSANILGGNLAAAGDYPSYGIRNSFITGVCGATLVAPDMMVTAAGCAGNFVGRNIFIGGVKFSGADALDTVLVTGELPHPAYNPITQENDVMLLKLQRDSTQPYRRLNTNALLPQDNEQVTTVGYGSTTLIGLPVNELMEVDVPVVPFPDCQAEYNILGIVAINDLNQICAGSMGAGRCWLDRGGPLLNSLGKVVGVAPGWNWCLGGSGIPDIYTRVSHYTTWIYNNICTLSADGCLPPDPCEPNPCLNGGTCLDEGHTFTCDCPTEDWVGVICDEEVIKPCDPNPCLNGGTCTENADDTFTCDCPDTHEGDTCETEIPTPCDPYPCENGGVCIPKVGVDDYDCICPSGFEGKDCQDPVASPCDPNPCENSGVCVPSGASYTCVCQPDYEGDNCEIEKPKPCEPNPCLNGGVCAPVNDAPFCICQDDYEGDRCQTEIPKPCEDNPCLNGGVCVPGDGENYTCNCTDDYEGDNCETEKPKPCDPNPCQNGGICSASGATFTCACVGDWIGTTCEQVDPASVATEAPVACGPFGWNFLCWLWCSWLGRLLGLCNLP